MHRTGIFPLSAATFVVKRDVRRLRWRLTDGRRNARATVTQPHRSSTLLLRQQQQQRRPMLRHAQRRALAASVSTAEPSHCQ